MPYLLLPGSHLLVVRNFVPCSLIPGSAVWPILYTSNTTTPITHQAKMKVALRNSRSQTNSIVVGGRDNDPFDSGIRISEKSMHGRLVGALHGLAGCI